jgi:hypothetical protein
VHYVTGGLSGSEDLQQHEVIYLIVLGFAAAGNAAMLFFASKPMREGISRDLHGSAVGTELRHQFSAWILCASGRLIPP